jgi:radical SAM superfamily enzyme YgiQ (UPF0313 family)
LVYLAAPLVQAGLEVVILDQSMDRHWEEKLLGALNQQTICVGITALTSPMITNGIGIARMVRQRASCPIVWGGVHASLEPDTTIRSEHVDVVVTGEGEETFAELVQSLRAKRPLASVNGILYKEGNTVCRTAPRAPYDLNRLPRLPFQLANLELYRGHPVLCSFFNFRSPLGISLETSRGCTHRCSYCVMASTESKTRAKWHGMAAEKMADTVEQVIKDYGVGGFVFVDDNFFVDVERVLKFLGEVERRNLKFEWFADVRMQTIVKKMDVPLLKRLERAGLRCLGIGIESGSDRILKMIHKGEDRAIYREANRMLASTSIIPRYGYLQGLPGETREDAAQTYELAATMLKENVNSSHSLNKLLPTPNTPIFEECVRRGLSRPQRLEDWAPFCDPGWRGGPAVWMDKDAVQLILDLFFFNLVLIWANPALMPGRGKRFVIRVATELTLFRVRHSFYAFRIERLLTSLLMRDSVLRQVRRFMDRIEGRRTRRLREHCTS